MSAEDTSTETGVISAQIETSLELPPTPLGLLQIANSFENVGYVNLARYLRACSDGMAPAHRPKAPTPAAARIRLRLRRDVDCIGNHDLYDCGRHCVIAKQFYAMVNGQGPAASGHGDG